MSLWNWDKPKFGTFDEKALNDGALKDAVVDMAGGTSPAVAILKSLKKGVRTMSDLDPTKPAVKSWINAANAVSSAAAVYAINALSDPAVQEALKQAATMIPVQYVPWAVLAMNFIIAIRRNFFPSKPIAGVVTQQ